MAAPSESSQLRRDYLWNSAASLMGSVALTIMLMVVTRTAGVAAAGIYSLAIAVGQQFQTLGMYEVRTYHVTDARRRFSFGTYLTARVLTVVLMVTGIVAYAVFSGGGASQVILVTLIASLRVFDAFEDVLYSEFQRSGRLDIGGRACFWRILTTTAVFFVGLVATGSLLWSTVIALVVSTAATVALYVPPARGLFPLAPAGTSGQSARCSRSACPSSWPRSWQCTWPTPRATPSTTTSMRGPRASSPSSTCLR